MPLINKCSVCNDNVNADKEISCDKCKLPLHSTCSGLSRSEIQCVFAKDRRVSYFCNKCIKCDNEVIELKKLIMDLKLQIDELKKSNCMKKEEYSPDSIVHEVFERQRRANNIVIYNIEESDPQSANDKTIATNLIKEISNIDTGNIRVQRLGKQFNNDKPRPLKITLPSSADAIQILKNKHKIKSLNNINIKQDQTPMQLKHLANLRTKLKARQDNGEKNLTIKYIYGQPQIISLKN
ncbi:hypothetical protein RN001_006309 [Aquatica leii]|uniref:PHD-type domain-containing protein n=1 Tax=Aquatica leii TaxID=1421715 RepID=A0AAN7SS82_9COLE|nr:hypothetical protein RN001_006309 [Aquatica leii]